MDEFDKMPIECMHRGALKKYIYGIDSMQMADLIFNLANCTKFEILAVPQKFFKAFSVWTKFYGVEQAEEQAEGALHAYGCSNWWLGQREMSAAKKIECYTAPSQERERRYKKCKTELSTRYFKV